MCKKLKYVLLSVMITVMEIFKNHLALSQGSQTRNLPKDRIGKKKMIHRAADCRKKNLRATFDREYL